MFTFGSLFAGIGGFDLGLERAGMQCRWQVEINDYCQRVLAKHWSNVPRFGDIKSVGKDDLEKVDLICGGFPCQPFSVAGKRGGKADDRYLWPEMLRVIREVRPTWVLSENVAGIINMELDTVLANLEAEGYETQTFVIPACGVDAPHRRNRVWIVGYSTSFRFNRLSIREFGGTQKEGRMFQSSGRSQNVANADRPGCGEQCGAESIQSELPPTECGGRWLPEPSVGGVVDGPAYWMDEPPDIPRVSNGVKDRVARLRALGNAVVPQVVEVLGRMILYVQSQSDGPASSEGGTGDSAQRP